MFYPLLRLDFNIWFFHLFTIFTEIALFDTTLKLVGLFFIFKIFKNFFRQHNYRKFSWLDINAHFNSRCFGILDATIKTLDNMAFNIGRNPKFPYYYQTIVTLILVIWLSGLITRKKQILNQ